MSGSVWDDGTRWEELKKPDACPICIRGGPLDVLVESGATWVTAGEEAPLPGYACVVSKHHVVEPFELPQADSDAFWREAMLAARALHRVYRPTKLNYEIHGNTIPHLHLHLFPRFAGDPFVGGPIDPGRVHFTRTRDDLAHMKQALADALDPVPRAI